jgi:hypothetical protein
MDNNDNLVETESSVGEFSYDEEGDGDAANADHPTLAPDAAFAEV